MADRQPKMLVIIDNLSVDVIKKSSLHPLLFMLHKNKSKNKTVENM